MRIFNSLIASFLATTVAANSRGIPVPYFRYRLYGDLEAAALEHADTLGYDVDLWNYPGSNELEFLSYQTIAQSEDGLALTVAIDGLGFTFDQWECFATHYGDYDWAELVAADLAQYYEAMGWNEEKWISDDEETYPESLDKFWDDLNKEEQETAVELCYTSELWNGLGLDLWPTLPEAITRAPTDTMPPTLAPLAASTDFPTPREMTPPDVSVPAPTNTSVPLILPPAPTVASVAVDNIRYVLWENLSEEQQDHATLLRYTAETWNRPGAASIESYSFEFVEAVTQIEGAETLILSLGFNASTWNCHINHFSYQSWEKNEERGITPFFVALGWSAESWAEEIDPPATSNMTWAELTDLQREAASAICYRQETYDYLPLTSWATLSEPVLPSTNTSVDEPPVDSPDAPTGEGAGPTTEDPTDPVRAPSSEATTLVPVMLSATLSMFLLSL